MKSARLLLYPFSIIYNLITSVRNYFYTKGIFKSTHFKTPVIAVGNLSVGGTGKSPQIEYLIRLLQNCNIKIATVSRGYKRESIGMLVAEKKHTALDLGDEPFQFFQKFPDVKVVVNANRVEAIDFIENNFKQVNAILLDDAMQHRKVKAGFYIMLTAFGDFFYKDFVLPAGNLRENRLGAKRANAIVVTKCPDNLTLQDKNRITKNIKTYATNVPVFFSKISYDSYIFSKNNKINITDIDDQIILLAGIAKPEPFFNNLKREETLCLVYPDHHNYTHADLQTILNKANGKKIITTEKDYARLLNKLPEEQLYYLPIASEFLFDQQFEFNSLITNYVDC